MFTDLRPKEELKMFSQAIKKLPANARFGLLMYAEGLSDRYNVLTEKSEEKDGDKASH